MMRYKDPKDDIRFREGLYWHGSTKPKKTIHAATLLQTVIGFALVTLFVIAVANYSINKALSQELEDTKKTAQKHKQSADNWLNQLITCINGGTLFDKTTNTALFCAKPIEVKL